MAPLSLGWLGWGRLAPTARAVLFLRERERGRRSGQGPTSHRPTPGMRLPAPGLAVYQSSLPVVLVSSSEPRLPRQRRHWLGLDACVRFRIRTVEVKGSE